MAGDNRFLGDFNLEGIPPARMGVPQIEVTFNIDANGILNVTARDKGTGKEQTIKIESSGGLEQGRDRADEARRRVARREDKKKRELAEARNTAEQRVYQLEKLLEEHKDKLSESDKSALRAAIDKVNEAKKGDDAAAINRAVDELQRASQAMAEHLYAAPGSRGRRRRRRPGPPARARPPAGLAQRRRRRAKARRRHRRRVRGEEVTRRGGRGQCSRVTASRFRLADRGSRHSPRDRPLATRDALARSATDLLATSSGRRHHGIPIRSTDPEEPGGRAGGPGAGAGPRPPADRADAPAGRAARPRAAGHPRRSWTSSASIPPRCSRRPRRG